MWLRSELDKRGCRYMFLSCLDEIAWLLNIRSNDVEYCPFVISFALVGPESVELFADVSKFRPDVRAELEFLQRMFHYSETKGAKTLENSSHSAKRPFTSVTVST